MTLFRLQNEKLARDNLDTAIELVEAPIWSSISEIDTAVELVEDQNGASSDGSPRAPVSWEDKIEWQLLRREAEALIGRPAGPQVPLTPMPFSNSE